jgi:inner membrane protein
MMAGSHVALGAAAWVVAAPRLGLPALSPACLALALTGSLLPDLDHPKSWLGRRLRLVSRPVAALLGHRGITHSALAVAACVWGLTQGGAPRWVVAPLAVGALSHLAADLLTPAGLRLAWPMRRTWALPLCRSGSAMEPLVVAVLLTLAGSDGQVPPVLRQAWREAGLAWPAAPACPAAGHGCSRPPTRPVAVRGRPG